GAPYAHPPVGPEGQRQQVDQRVEGGGGVGGELLDRLEVEEEIATGGVPRDPHDRDPVEAAARRDHRVGHLPGREVEQYVVNGEPVAALDDLDRPDVATGLTDRGRHPAQGTGDVGQLHTE